MEWLFAIAVVMSFCAVFLGLYALHHSFNTAIELRAMQKSTHKVQFVPVDPPSDLREFDREMGRAERRDMDNLHSIHDNAEALM